MGLDQVRHTKVSGLTTSEKRRLNVACHLLLDTDIVLLDQPTRGMDIFDTFFLVEFLRQWAATAGSSGPAALTPSGEFQLVQHCSLMVCTAWQTSCNCSHQGESAGQGTWHTVGRKCMHAGSVVPEGKRQLERTGCS